MRFERTSARGSLTEVVDRIGEVFVAFDARTQDSGHISYGVRDEAGNRWFVKTPGDDVVSAGGSDRVQRSRALLSSAKVSTAVEHTALIPVERIIDTDEGPVVVSAWFDGELVRAPASLRGDPRQAFNRFKALPVDEIVAALDTVIDLHVQVADAGWVAGDFYDGCLMYDFDGHTMKVMDFECYHRGPYINTVGVLPGSTRFMAPEESTEGACVNERTTVYNLGRMIQILLLTRHPGHSTHEIARLATNPDPALRPASLRDLQRSWRSAVGR